jgi:hypothetical protein
VQQTRSPEIRSKEGPSLENDSDSFTSRTALCPADFRLDYKETSPNSSVKLGLANALRQRSEELRLRAEKILNEKTKERLKKLRRAASSCNKTNSLPGNVQESLSTLASHPELYSTHGNSSIYQRGTMSSVGRSTNARRVNPPPGTYASAVRGPILARFFEGLCTDAFLEGL